MKKIHFFPILLVLLLCFSILPLSAFALETPAEEFEYSREADGIYIDYYYGNRSSVVIPEKIDGVPVVGVSGYFLGNDTINLTLPSSVRFIENSMSYTLENIYVSSANSYFSSVNGVLFNKAKTTLYQYPQGRTEKSYTIPSTVKTIHEFAFENSRLTAVTIPNSVLQIGWCAFSGSQFSTIKLGSGLTTIGDYAFSSCANLKSLAIPDSVKTLGNFFVYNCELLTDISIGAGVAKVYDGTFQYCPNLKNLTLSSANKSFVMENGALYNKAKTVLHRYTEKTPAKSFTIPNTVNRILYGSFQNCTALADLKFPNKALDIGDSALHSTKWFQQQKNGVVYAGPNAYTFKGYMLPLYHLKLKDGTLAIADYAFYAQEKLRSVTLPSSIKAIGRSAFQQSYNLTNLNLNEGLISIGEEAFDCLAISSLSIPSSVRSIGRGAFERNEFLKNVSLPNGLTFLGEYAFAFSGLTKIVLPPSLKELKADTFNFCWDLKSVTIPASVTKITYSPFDGCSDLTISGYKNTQAESYATKYGHSFKALTPITVTGIKLNTSSTKGELGVGESKQLGVKFTPADATYRKISWKSSNETVASVSATGLVKANATGTAKITASSTNGKTATYTVTVKKAPSSVALNYSKATIGVGEKTLDLNSTVNSGAASNKRSYTTSNSAVATVDANGVVTGKKVGTATITVTTYNGRTAKCVVTVRSAPSSITLNYKSKTLSKGGKVDLNSSVNSGAGAFLRKYSSNNTKVATVDVNGIVTAKAAGKATITVKTFNGRSATCLITVK